MSYVEPIVASSIDKLVATAGTRPKGTFEEDPDKVRGEVFKRMFPDLPKKFS